MHRFEVGQLVAFHRDLRPWRRGAFTVVRVLAGAGVPEYRIKSADEPYERSALENELREIIPTRVRSAA